MTAKHLALNLSRLQRQPLRDPSPHPRPPAVPRHRSHFRPACHARGPAPVNARAAAPCVPPSPASSVAPAFGGGPPPDSPASPQFLLAQLFAIFTSSSTYALPLMRERVRCARHLLHAFQLVSLESRLAQLEQNIAA